MIRLIAVVFVISRLPASALAGGEIASYADAKEFRLVVEDRDLLAAPEWKADAENPPLSAARAIKLATDYKEALLKRSGEGKWECVGAELRLEQYINRWYWEVSFEPHRGHGSVFQHLIIVVLMDGKMPKPRVTKLH